MQINRLDILRQMLEQQPDDPELMYAIGFEMESRGDDAAASEWYEKVLSAHPEYLPAYYQYGNLRARHGQEEQALELLDKGIELARRIGNTRTLRELMAAREEIE